MNQTAGGFLLRAASGTNGVRIDPLEWLAVRLGYTSNGRRAFRKERTVGCGKLGFQAAGASGAASAPGTGPSKRPPNLARGGPGRRGKGVAIPSPAASRPRQTWGPSVRTCRGTAAAAQDCLLQGPRRARRRDDTAGPKTKLGTVVQLNPWRRKRNAQHCKRVA